MFANLAVFVFDALDLTLKASSTTEAEFANTVDPDETSHYEPSHLDHTSGSTCLPCSL